MTVYIVTSGEYSDYGINVVFSTREKADAYVKIHNRGGPYDSAGVEEYEVDDIGDESIRPGYEARLSGKIEVEKESTKECAIGERCMNYSYGHYCDIDKRYSSVGYGETQEQALKVARDNYAKARAEREIG